MSVKIVSYKDYVAGWLDSSIHDFLEVLSQSDASTKYALITCLDSNLNPATLRTKSPELKSITRKLQILGTGLLLGTDVLLKADSRNRIFFGFDEVWFFPNKSLQSGPPPGLLVGPSRLDQARFKRIAKWMSENSCSLALGGGAGLSFVIRAHGPVRSVLEYLIEQREPSLASA